MTQGLPLDNADMNRPTSNNNSTIPSIPLFPDSDTVMRAYRHMYAAFRGGIDDIEAEQNDINEDEDSNVI